MELKTEQMDQKNFTSYRGTKSLQATLERIFPTQQEETRIQKARRIMGEKASMLSDEELDNYLTMFQYLIDSWLDEYERMALNGKTLQEFLMEA